MPTKKQAIFQNNIIKISYILFLKSWPNNSHTINMYYGVRRGELQPLPLFFIFGNWIIEKLHGCGGSIYSLLSTSRFCKRPWISLCKRISIFALRRKKHIGTRSWNWQPQRKNVVYIPTPEKRFKNKNINVYCSYLLMFVKE